VKHWSSGRATIYWMDAGDDARALTLKKNQKQRLPNWAHQNKMPKAGESLSYNA
jgi:hypothetical protein